MENDQTLLEHLARDPEEGMAELMQRYTGLVWSAAAEYLGDPEDIKECVNDTFAEFYRERERFDPEKGSLKLYLATIARRRAIDRLRASGRAETVPLQEDALGGDGVPLEERAALSAALDSLTEEDQAIIRMKYYGGMSFRETASFFAIQTSHSGTLSSGNSLACSRCRRTFSQAFCTASSRSCGSAGK